MTHWSDEYPHEVTASVLLLDGDSNWCKDNWNLQFNSK